MWGPLRALGAGAVLAAMLGGPAAAWATRYASSTGTSSESCASPATACDLKTAVAGNGVNNPKAGEEVIVEPGTYKVTTKIESTVAPLTVRGAAGQPRPVITSKAVTVFKGSGLSLAYLTIEQSGLSSEPAIHVNESTVERMLIRGEPSGNVLVDDFNGTLKDSVIVARKGSTSGAVGMVANGGPDTETLRNDTIVAESEEEHATAIEVDQQEASPKTKLTINAYNTIAINTAGKPDVFATAGGVVAMNHSDYAKPEGEGEVVEGAGRVKAPPLFVEAAKGNFAEATGSPTIDAGLNEEANGPFDYEGNPRTSGAATDIGAFEVQVPAPPKKEPETPKGTSGGTVPGTGSTPLVLGQPFESDERWRESRSKGSKKLPVGTVFTFTLNQAATATFTFTRKVQGRKVKGVCVARTRRNLHKRRCTRSIRSTLTLGGHVGLNAIDFQGQVSGGKLPRGSYSVVVTVTNAFGQRASSAPLKFTILA
jgi:hypothetical protein